MRMWDKNAPVFATTSIHYCTNNHNNVLNIWVIYAEIGRILSFVGQNSANRTSYFKLIHRPAVSL